MATTAYQTAQPVALPQPQPVPVVQPGMVTTTTTTRTLITGDGTGEYTFYQPQRCCELRRVSMTVNVQEGHVVHDTRTGFCCMVCDERYVRESDIASVVTVNTYIASEACRIFRIVTSMLLFVVLFTSSVTLLCLMTGSDYTSTLKSTVSALSRRLQSSNSTYGQYYSPSTYYSPSPSSYYNDYYGGVSVGFGASYGAVGLCLSILFFVIGVGAWVACCLRLHHVSVVLKSAGFRRSTMDIWLTPPDTARLGEAVKLARAAQHHTRMGDDLDSIVVTANSALADAGLLRQRGVVAAPATTMVTTTVSSSGTRPVAAAGYPYGRPRPPVQPNQQPLLNAAANRPVVASAAK